MYPSALSFDQWHSCLYDRVPGDAFGEEENALLSPAAQDARLCFNCGSPDHTVSSCPEPIDRVLVSLSRQIFNFLHPNPGGQEFTRFHVAEAWKQQRLEWLKVYKPGVIQGPLLRDALGLQEGDLGCMAGWLRNMAYWGYPPGWVGHRDPTELVLHRILEDEAEAQGATAEWDPLTIFEGADDKEEIDLRMFDSHGGPSSTTASSLTVSSGEERTRWATYPGTYFSSTALSIYNGTPLDGMCSSPSVVSVTFTPERRILWKRILSGDLGTSPVSPVPPWRKPDAFGASISLAPESVVYFIPSPPSTTPPPLPLTPSMTSFRSEGIADDESIVDMDMSDPE